MTTEEYLDLDEWYGSLVAVCGEVMTPGPVFSEAERFFHDWKDELLLFIDTQ